MIKRNTEFVNESMQQPFWRFIMDSKYNAAWTDSNIDDDDVRYDELYTNSITFIVKDFAQKMQEISYPFNIGNAEELNESGELIVNMHLHSLEARQIDPNTTESIWKTFRDDDPSGYVSLHTGTVAIPFEKHWIDLDEKSLSWV